MRLILAWVAAAGIGAVGALILGEYTYSGVAVLLSGLFLGLFVAEGAVAVARHRSVTLGTGCALLAAAAMTWGGWISSGHRLSFLPGEGWAAVVVAGAAAGLRAWWSRPAADSPPP